ncbi:hypothetical protein MMC28_002893 [Mycoblastus sanguinarius]|nr:hypothetical protein [Mycoblastus sanguinarius]
MNTSHSYWTDFHQASRTKPALYEAPETKPALHEVPETKSNGGFAGGDVIREERERAITLDRYARDEHGARLSPDTIAEVMEQPSFRGQSNVLGTSDKEHWDSKSMLAYLKLRAISLERAALARVRSIGSALRKKRRRRFGGGGGSAM